MDKTKFKHCGKCPKFLKDKCTRDSKCYLAEDPEKKKSGTGNHPKNK